MDIRHGQYFDFTTAWQTQFAANKIFLRQALSAAAGYSGDQASYDRVIAELAVLETAINAQNLNALPRRAAERQFFIALGIMNAEHITISGLLNWAQKNCDAYIANSVKQPNATIKLPFVFVPTKPQPIPPGGGNGKFEEPRFEPRLTEVLQHIIGQEFNGRRINRDELLIYEGEVHDKMMRKVPYNVVEIPLLGKQIAVCNQVGEAIFVSHKLLTPLEWATFGKEALEEQLGCTRIVMDNNWRAKLTTALNTPSLASDFIPPTAVEIITIIQQRRKIATAERVPITDAMRQEFQQLLNKTGLRAKTILLEMEAMGIVQPPELNVNIINRISFKNNQAVTILPNHWSAIMRVLIETDQIFITEQMRRKLISEKQRTLLAGAAIIVEMQRLHMDCPAGLTVSMINAWTGKQQTQSGKNWAISTCRATHWAAVMTVFKKTEHMQITEAMRAELKKWNEKTGLGHGRIMPEMHRLGIACPVGLTGNVIRSWLIKKADGNWNTNTCYRSHWTAAMQTLYKTDQRIITEEMRRKLLVWQARSGLKAQAIIALMKEFDLLLPKDLTEATIRYWTRKGKNGNWEILECRQQHWNAVLAAYNFAERHNIFQIQITDAMRRNLLQQIERTGLGADIIFNTLGQQRPIGLTIDIARKLKNIGSCRKSHWDTMIACYAQQTDKPVSYHNKNNRVFTYEPANA